MSRGLKGTGTLQTGAPGTTGVSYLLLGSVSPGPSNGPHTGASGCREACLSVPVTAGATRRQEEQGQYCPHPSAPHPLTISHPEVTPQTNTEGEKQKKSPEKGVQGGGWGEWEGCMFPGRASAGQMLLWAAGDCLPRGVHLHTL